MSVDLDHFTRDATALLRNARRPLHRGFVLLGLLALRLENQLLAVETWPERAAWDTIRDGSESGVSAAVAHLQVSEATRPIGEVLEQLGLTDLERLDLNAERREEEEEAPFERIFRFVDEVEVSSLTSEDVSAFTDQILDFAISEAGKDGAHYTPAMLSDLVADILNPGPEDSLFDLATGSGGLLLALHEKGRENGEDGSTASTIVAGQELEPEVAALAQLNMLLHGIDAEIAVGNTLTVPRQVDGDSLQTFDYVVGNPPIGLRATREVTEQLESDKYDRFKLAPVGRRLTSAFIQHLVASLNAKGRGAIVVPNSLLKASGREQALILSLLQQDLLETVVQLPPGTLSYTTIAPALLILNRSKNERQEGRVLLVDASEEYAGGGRDRRMEERHRKKIAGVIRGMAEVDQFSTAVENSKLIEEGGSLWPERHLMFSQLGNCLKGLARWVELRSIADVTKGSVSQTVAQGAEPVITLADLVDLPKEKRMLRKHLSPEEARVDDLVRASAGDVLIPLAAVSGAPTVAVVPEALEGVPLHRSIARVRLEPRHAGLASFTADFFSSSTGKQLLSSLGGGNGVGHVLLSDLRSAQVPIPNDTVEELLQSLRTVEDELAKKVEQAKRVRTKIFGVGGDEGESILRETSAEAQMLGDSLIQANNQDYQIRNFYPFPLAYSYRELTAIGDPTQRHKEILRVVENALSFLACVGISLGIYSDTVPDESAPSLSREAIRSAWDSGIAVGTWRELARASAKALGADAPTSLGRAFASAWYQGGKTTDLHTLSEKLVEKRNAAAHGRGPKTWIEYEEEAEALRTMLGRLYKKLSFFVRHPLYLVDRIDQPWGESQFEIEALAYVGDHPGMRREKIMMSNAVTRGILYVEAEEEVWVPLYPLISVEYCPTCKHRETYVLDRWEGGDRFSLKSFERGHAINEEQAHSTVGQHLRQIF